MNLESFKGDIKELIFFQDLKLIEEIADNFFHDKPIMGKRLKVFKNKRPYLKSFILIQVFELSVDNEVLFEDFQSMDCSCVVVLNPGIRFVDCNGMRGHIPV